MKKKLESWLNDGTLKFYDTDMSNKNISMYTYLMLSSVSNEKESVKVNFENLFQAIARPVLSVEVSTFINCILMETRR